MSSSTPDIGVPWSVTTAEEILRKSRLFEQLMPTLLPVMLKFIVGRDQRRPDDDSQWCLTANAVLGGSFPRFLHGRHKMFRASNLFERNLTSSVAKK